MIKRLLTFTVVALGLFALVGVFSPVASGQSAGKRALAKNRYHKSKSGARKTGKKTWGDSGPGSAIPKNEMPTYEKPTAKVLEKAAKDQIPLLIYFVEEGMDLLDAERVMTGKEMAKMSRKAARFILIEYNGDRTPSMDDGSPIPTSKLLGPNPSRDYRITSYPAFLICDSYGNEVYRTSKPLSESALKKQFDAVNKRMDATRAKLKTNLDAAKKALEKKATSKVFKALFKNFKVGVVGLKEQDESIRVYREIVDSARTEVEQLLEAGDSAGIKRLKAMKKIFKVTELKGEIEDAIDILKG